MLILIAHGSPRPTWRASVERLTSAIQACVGDDAIRLAYMDCTPPTLMQVASEAVQNGATHMSVLPLFLTGEGHVERNVRPQVDAVRTAHPEIHIELLPPVGQHPLFSKMLEQIAREAGD